MKQFMLIVGVAVAVGATGRNAWADEPKPEQIIDKAIRAHGGEERLIGLSGFSLKDRVVYEKGPTWNYEVDAAPPTRYRSEIKSGPEDKNRSVIVIDGDHGWLKRGDQVEVYPPTFLDTMRNNTIPFVGPRSILRLRAPEEPTVPVFHGRRMHHQRPSGGWAPDEARRRAPADVVLRQGIWAIAQDGIPYRELRRRRNGHNNELRGLPDLRRVPARSQGDQSARRKARVNTGIDRVPCDDTKRGIVR